MENNNNSNFSPIYQQLLSNIQDNYMTSMEIGLLFNYIEKLNTKLDFALTKLNTIIRKIDALDNPNKFYVERENMTLDEDQEEILNDKCYNNRLESYDKLLEFCKEKYDQCELKNNDNKEDKSNSWKNELRDKRIDVIIDVANFLGNEEVIK